MTQSNTLGAEWLSDTYTNTNMALGCVQTYGQTYPTYWPWPATVTAAPIRLTLAEIDVLRKRAKDDEALKAILRKFTSSIEVIVAFP